MYIHIHVVIFYIQFCCELTCEILCLPAQIGNLEIDLAITKDQLAQSMYVLSADIRIEKHIDIQDLKSVHTHTCVYTHT